jgi:hypothetical protein
MEGFLVGVGLVLLIAIMHLVETLAEMRRQRETEAETEEARDDTPPPVVWL